MSRQRMIGWAWATGLFACSQSHDVFVPAQNPPATSSVRPYAVHPVPSRTDDGDVEVQSFGVRRTVNGAPCMHVRMTVSNDSDSRWTLDTRQQLAVIPGVGRLSPVWATSNLSEPPHIRVGPGEQALVDLLFPLPSAVHLSGGPPRFNVVWHVETEHGPVSDRARFDRTLDPYRLQPVAAYSAEGLLADEDDEDDDDGDDDEDHEDDENEWIDSDVDLDDAWLDAGFDDPLAFDGFGGNE